MGQLSTCLNILPLLNVGLDVNCKFSGPKDFEFTQELQVFDLLDIGLYHGWVVSAQDVDAFNAFGHLSYNQVVERLIAFEEAQQHMMYSSVHTENTAGSENETKTREMIKAIEEGTPIKEFLDRTASQLSYEGLLTLHAAVGERELGIFYRNCHFNTLLKYNGELYFSAQILHLRIRAS